MIRYQRADATHPHFTGLVDLLDRELAIRDGADHAFYHQFNHLTDIKHTIIAYDDDVPIGCGAFKPYDDESVEIKRMFTHPDRRKLGVAAGVLAHLEAWAAELGYRYGILETGMKQPEAIALYGKQGYARMTNYGQYAGVDNSVHAKRVDPMKIATYNVNGVNGRLPVLLQWLKESAPDIVCLQELKAPQEKFPEAAITEAGYEAIWHGQKSWNGVAVLSRIGTPLETARGLPGEDDDEQSRYLQAVVNGITIGCLYLPNGNPTPGPKFDYKLRWFDRLKKHAAGLLDSKQPVILCGDYNVMPTERDVYKPERWVEDALFRPEIREAFHQLVAQGWTDALRKLYPDETIYTFWDYFRNAFGRNAGLRIDHFLLSPDLVPHLKAGGVDREVRSWEKTSDHAPVWIEIDR